MAQEKNSPSQDLLAEKGNLDKFFEEANSSLSNLSQKLRDANAAGDTDLTRRLSNDLLSLKSFADSKSERYAEIESELKKPELAKISEATKRLREGESERRFFLPVAAPGGGGISTMLPSGLEKTQQELDAQKKKDLSVATNIPPEKISLDSGSMPAEERFFLGALQSGVSEAKYLTDKYGENNVYPVQIDGETKFVIRKKDGSAFTTEKSGVAGFSGAAIVEAPILAAEIGSALGTLATTKSPTLALVASSATRANLGPLVDGFFEKTAGVEPQWYRAYLRRGGEALVSFVAGGVIDRAFSKYIGNRVSSSFPNDFAQNLEKSASRIVSREEAAAKAAGREAGEISIPSGAVIGGPRGLETQQQLAGAVPDSGFVGSMKRTQETIRGLWDSFSKGVKPDPAKFANVAKAQRANQEKLTREIAGKANMSAEVVQANIDSRIAAYRSIDANKDELGQLIGRYVLEEDEVLRKAKENEVNTLFDLADKAGFEMQPRQLYDIFVNLRRQQNPGGAISEAAVSGVESDLRRRAFAEDLLLRAKLKRGDLQQRRLKVPFELEQEITELSKLRGPINAREFDLWIRRYGDARQENMVGASTKDVLGGMISNEASALRRKMYSDFNVDMPDGSVINLGDQFQIVTDRLKAREQLQKGLLSGIVREELGTNKMFPREIVNAVMAEPTKIRKVLGVLKDYEASDPKFAGITADVTDKMQRQYFNSLGFNRPGLNAASINYDRQMVEELWGNAAPRVMQDIDEIRKVASKYGSDVVLTFDDLKQMGSFLDQTSRDKVKSQIEGRLRAESKLKLLENSQIFKLAKQGDFKSIDPDALSRAILSDSFTIGDTKDVLVNLSRFSTDARNAYKGDFIRELLNRFPGGDSPAGPPFTPMFDTEGYVKAMDSPLGKSPLRKKIELVLGSSDDEFLYDLSKVYNANKIIPRIEGDAIRATLGLGGISVYAAHGVSGSIRNKLMAAMLSTGSKRYGLKRALAKEIGGGAVDEQYRMMFKDLFTTRTGLMALANQAKDDEEFSDYLVDMAKRFRDDDIELNSIIPEQQESE
jgi:hypothetical protein